MNLDAVLKTFIDESRELLLCMEDSVLALERDPHDEDAIGSTFRAIHTIKGSAGLFALDRIVTFSHVVENVLDRVRDKRLVMDAVLCGLLLECRDHIALLVEEAAGATVEDAAERDSAAQRLLQRLEPYQSLAVELADHATVEVDKPASSNTGDWHISIRFGREVLRNGMEPSSFLRYLNTLGRITHIVTLAEAIPDAAQMDPEQCYLGFEISFRGAVDKETIASVFEFVRDDCQLSILPPDSKVDEYLRLIEDATESRARIGEILLACGAVTREELDKALSRQQERGDPMPRLGELLVEDGAAPPNVVQAALDKQKQTKDRKAAEAMSVRVDAQKLEALITQVGELVIASASASLTARRMADPALIEAMSLVGRMVEEVRDSALGLRMVEIGDTFQRFNRVVRDVSRELGKEIELHISGADTEMDKTVVERIADPLTHLVRNAIDHGIESVATRIANGKPAAGRIRLDARHESGSVVIEIGDDGGGLNRDRILAKALERGLVQPNHNLSDQEIYELIFEPGFSTADTVTNLSGRGVGMDVVRRNIQALRGTVDLDSVAGQGTTFRIRLPLTLAIIDGFLVEVGASSFVVPLDMVVECMELSPADQASADKRNYLNLRGEVLPYLRLRSHFGDNSAAPVRENVVVVAVGNRKAGLVVDRLLGEFQTVIKPLGQVFRQLRGISGSTILGSGEVALILDVLALVQQAENAEETALRTSPQASLR